MYLYYLAKKLGVFDFGLYTTAITYFVFTSSLVDFGISRFLMREISQKKYKINDLLLSILTIRISIILLILVIFITLSFKFDSEPRRIYLILIAIIITIPQALALSIDSIFIASMRFKLSSISSLLATMITIILGILLIHNGFRSLGALFALGVGQLVYATILLAFYLRKNKIFFKSMNIDLIKNAVNNSIYYSIIGAIGLLYFKIDTLLLSYIKGPVEVGVYSVAYRFFETSSIIPSSVAIVLFPRLSKMHNSSPSQIKTTILSITKLMTFVSLLVFLSMYFVVPKIIDIFLNDYSLSTNVIKILAFSIPFMFIHIPLAQALLSSKKFIKIVVGFSIIPLAFNIIMNLLLIPKYGYIASAWITVFSDIISLIVLIYFINRLFLKDSHYD